MMTAWFDTLTSTTTGCRQHPDGIGDYGGPAPGAAAGSRPRRALLGLACDPKGLAPRPPPPPAGPAWTRPPGARRTLISAAVAPARSGAAATPEGEGQARPDLHCRSDTMAV